MQIDCKDERDWGAFIPRFLDDYGLDPFEFRVYAHLSRRIGNGGRCWEGLQRIANTCQMNIKSARKAISNLTLFGLIRQRLIPGKTNEITLTNQCDWVGSEDLDPLREREKPTPTESGRGAKTEDFKPTPTESGRTTPTESGRAPLPNQVGDGTHIRYSVEGTPNNSRSIESKKSTGQNQEPEKTEELASITEAQESSLSIQKLINEDQCSAAAKKSQKRKIQVSFERFQQVYNAYKPPLFSGLQVVNPARQKVLEKLVSDFGNEDQAITTLENALKFAAQDDWYACRSLTFENFASNNKVHQLSERWQNLEVQQNRPWLIDGNLDLDFLKDRATVERVGSTFGGSRLGLLSEEDCLVELVKRYRSHPDQLELDWAAYCLKNQRYVENVKTRLDGGAEILLTEQRSAIAKLHAVGRGFSSPGYSKPQATAVLAPAIPFGVLPPSVTILSEAISQIRPRWVAHELSWSDPRLLKWLEQARAVEPFEFTDTHLGFHGLPEWVVCKLAQDLPALTLDGLISKPERVLVAAINQGFEDQEEEEDEEF